MRLVFVLLFVFGLCAEEVSELPSTAQRLVDRHDHELAELRERYLADVADLREDVTRDLERELKKVTRRGDLEGALAIKEKIAQLKEQEEAIAETPTDFLGRSSTPAFAGNTYKKSDRWSVTFKEDGSLHTNWTDHRMRDGRWEVEDDTILFLFGDMGEEPTHRAKVVEDRLEFDSGHVYVLDKQDDDE